jgi:hypothetical protein
LGHIQAIQPIDEQFPAPAAVVVPPRVPHRWAPPVFIVPTPEAEPPAAQPIMLHAAPIIPVVHHWAPRIFVVPTIEPEPEAQRTLLLWRRFVVPPPVATIYLQGRVQRKVSLSGQVRRTAQLSGRVQRKVLLSGSTAFP